MLINILVTIFAVLIFLFLFWKRLQEDYSAEIIFRTATYILLGIGIGWMVSFKYLPVWFFWITFLMGIIGLHFAILQFKIKFYETLEAFVIASLPWIGLIFLTDSATRLSLSSFLAFVGILILVFVSYYFDTHYKGFNWYKSGKIGFTGLMVAIIFFLVRSVIAIFKVTMLSLVGSSEAIISGVVALTALLLLYNLGRVKNER